MAFDPITGVANLATAAIGPIAQHFADKRARKNAKKDRKQVRSSALQQSQRNASASQQQNQQLQQNYPGLYNQEPQGDLWHGMSPYNQQIPNLTPQQYQSQNALLGPTTNALADQNLDTAGYNEAAQANINNYKKYAEPMLAARLNFQGIQGPQYAGALSSGLADIENANAQNRLDYGLRRRDQNQNLYGQLMNPAFSNLHTPGTAGLKAQTYGVGQANESPQWVGRAIQAGGNALQSLFDSSGQGNQGNKGIGRGGLSESEYQNGLSLYNKKYGIQAQQQQKQQEKLSRSQLGGNPMAAQSQGQMGQQGGASGLIPRLFRYLNQ